MDGYMSEAKKKEAVGPERLELESANVKAHQIEMLKGIFPEVFSESSQIDFERLKITLGEFVGTGKERYSLNWAGKSECYATIQRPSPATLRPEPNRSVLFQEADNLLIEGDNLEVLKLLQKSYLGKIKAIYIDPPYNTGKDFIYPDNYSESLETYLSYTNQVDEQGRKFSTNSETDGRFHSKWLSMMYSRLFLARNLLSDEGAIFISIDNHEIENLLKIGKEIFGEENWVATIANVNNPKGRSDDKYIATAHEYVVVFKRNILALRGWKPGEHITRRYNKSEQDGRLYREIDLRKTGDNDLREDRPNLFYYFHYNAKTLQLLPSRDETPPSDDWISIKPQREDGREGNWRWELKTSEANISSLFAKFMPVRRVWSVFEKDYFIEGETVKPTSAWTMKEVNSERGTEQFLELGFEKGDFPRPKPLGLVNLIIDLILEPKANDIILDFFAGSGTTGEAVLRQNHADGGNRKFILVQLPELIEEGGSKVISDISRTRLNKVLEALEKLNSETQMSLVSTVGRRDRQGYRSFKLDTSNFVGWAPSDSEHLNRQLELHVQNIRSDRTDFDIFFELLLKSGFEPSSPYSREEFEGGDIYTVGDSSLVIALQRKVTKQLISKVVQILPVRVIMLDSAFAGNDQLKVNAVETFKAKGITFKTV